MQLFLSVKPLQNDLALFNLVIYSGHGGVYHAGQFFYATRDALGKNGNGGYPYLPIPDLGKRVVGFGGQCPVAKEQERLMEMKRSVKNETV